ncbi:MAG: FRG domain-containing protein [Candidatus Methanofastidiosa archaeon]|nr:FRG domain-containing protein [Candidatus Methanofastidiosa archaeon]
MELAPVSSSGVFESEKITSIEQFIYDVELVTSKWSFEDDISACPWFRGATNGLRHKPLPTVLRKEFGDRSGSYDEFQLTRMFRNRAAVMGETPPRNDIDQWLFLMRHFGLPTRLLDWTEGALIALFFAVCGSDLEEDPAVWMIHPLELNKKTPFIEFVIPEEYIAPHCQDIIS